MLVTSSHGVELHFGHDAKATAPAAPKRPHQIAPFGHLVDVATSIHQSRAPQPVAGQSMLACIESVTAAERDTAQTHHGARARGQEAALRHKVLVHLHEPHGWLGDDPPRCSAPVVVHHREINHHSAIVDAIAFEVMAAALDACGHPFRAGQLHGLAYAGLVQAHSDDGRLALDA